MSKTTALPEAFGEKSPEWHLGKFIEFTKLKRQIGEPSPHLAVVGYLSKDSSLDSKLWLLGCYAATYCLPTAQVLWSSWGLDTVKNKPKEFKRWLTEEWKGIITRTERRCVRTASKMFDCLTSYVDWTRKEYPKLFRLGGKNIHPHKYYDRVWDSVSGIRYFGRYINIRLVEGLRRYCGLPARLHDIRSLGGWSPKKCLAYLYPECAEKLLIDNAEGNNLTNFLAGKLLDTVRAQLPSVDEYILAAMLCEYKGAYEKRHQYPGWTIDQEPLLYDKVMSYWGDRINNKLLWEARKNLFPKEVLGEECGWNGTRWSLAATLRDHSYNWSDLLYDYKRTTDFSKPVNKASEHGRKERCK